MKSAGILFAIALCVFGETLAPSDVKIVGSLDYGQTSDPVEYTGSPRYNAFVFNGNSGDQIQVVVTGKGNKVDVGIADGSLKVLKAATDRLEFTLPNHGPDLETYYLLFRDAAGNSAKFTVEIKKLKSKTAYLRIPSSQPVH